MKDLFDIRDLLDLIEWGLNTVIAIIVVIHCMELIDRWHRKNKDK